MCCLNADQPFRKFISDDFLKPENLISLSKCKCTSGLWQGGFFGGCGTREWFVVYSVATIPKYLLQSHTCPKYLHTDYEMISQQEPEKKQGKYWNNIDDEDEK